MAIKFFIVKLVIKKRIINIITKDGKIQKILLETQIGSRLQKFQH